MHLINDHDLALILYAYQLKATATNKAVKAEMEEEEEVIDLSTVADNEEVYVCPFCKKDETKKDMIGKFVFVNLFR